MNKAEAFIIEDSYIDKDWRDEYSIFYSKTFYNSISKFTTRVHVIAEEIESLGDLTDKNYVGHFILRPLHIKDAKLLKVVVKPMKEPLGVNSGEDLYLATCDYTAHIGGLFAPKVKTFPFYQQDSAVTICAYADMWMLTEYMHRRFGFNRPYIRDFISLTLPLRGRVVPSRGLLAEQMCIILSSLGYNVSIDSAASTDIEERIIKRIDAYLESGLPTILAFDNHVVVVAGHTLDESGNRDYIIYDDSGYHLADLLGLSKDEVPPFASKVDRKTLIEKLENVPRVLAINVEFDKLFYPLKSVEKITDIFLKDSGIKNEITKKRILLADSNEFKTFCNKVGVDAFDDLPLPHYVWIVELYRENELLWNLILDASAHKEDTTKNVRIAAWLGDKIIYGRSDKEKKVGRCPVIYSNLQKIE
ncbi:hypothetical protein [Archaeoglobus veneficus]|uniref:Uncharacterized protein n=1 Tax=Archaeoglobus veneficus (strain DSM 11195 / SNP6) TaxID=693661 RepID=F2KP41_ARCVS|nr:hypothetical protein [Archaeoglobus veneficus]AEA46349.1 hypothetical protein Arcve_0315 [Archaeoglobus veneficus SNP6]